MSNVARFNLPKGVSTCLKGLACLLIVLHHWCNVMMTIWHENALLDVIALRGGVTGVAVFFFLSSYGLTRSQSKRRDDVLTFFKKRLIKVIVPLLITNVLWFVIRYHGQGFSHSVFQIINVYDLLDRVTWFCNVILVCYVIFFISSRVKSLWGRIASNWSLTLFLAALFIYLWPDDPYLVYSLVSFPLGFTIASLQDRMMPMPLVLGVCLITMLFLGSLAIMANGFRQLFVANVYSTGIILIMLLIWIVCCRNTKIFNGLQAVKTPLLMLGACSYEIYLLHNKALMLHSEYGTSVWFPLSFLVVVIPLAIALYIIDNKVNSLFTK